MVHEHPNWSVLETGGYVVRTQAGFVQARRDWHRVNDFTEWDPKWVEGYPVKYPSIVQFRYEFGPNVVYANCTPVNDHVRYLTARIAELSNH